MTTAMFISPTPWPVVSAERELGLATLGPPDPDEQPDPDTWIANLGTLPLLAQPGERWLYNTGASVLGVLLARAAGAAARRGSAHPDLRAPRDARHRVLDDGHRPPRDLLQARARRAWWCGMQPDGRWSRQPAFGDGASGPSLHRR